MSRQFFAGRKKQTVSLPIGVVLSQLKDLILYFCQDWFHHYDFDRRFHYCSDCLLGHLMP